MPPNYSYWYPGDNDLTNNSYHRPYIHLAARHNDGGLIGYMDGHAKWHTASDIRGQLATGGIRWAPGIQAW